MDNKEIKISVPDGYEIDYENSTFECIKFKRKSMNYKDVAEALFGGQCSIYFINARGDIESINVKDGCLLVDDPNNAPTKQQLEKVIAYNKLLNVAYYFNSKHAPDGDSVYSIYYDALSGELLVERDVATFYCGNVLFNDRNDAIYAIEILGEAVVKTALGVI